MDFMTEKFMLHSKTAEKLFFDYAKDMPICDYHCHLIPSQVAENKHFDNLAQLWLSGDHYKWRAMRSCGIDEAKITGAPDDYDKYLLWASAMPYLIGNPLYHWTHLELQRFFGITKPLCPENAKYIWDCANEQIADKDFNVENIFKKFGVKFVGTTDSPADSLEHHIKYAAKGGDTIMAPSFRPDPVYNIHLPAFKGAVSDLAKAANIEISDLAGLISALESRMDFFGKNGCRISDHGIEYPPYIPCTDAEADTIFKKALAGEEIAKTETEKYQTYMMIFFGEQYAKRGWVMQLHMNAIRNNNTAMFEKLGADTGFDSIHDLPIAYNLSHLLNDINSRTPLPKTILYSLNPKDNYVIGTMLGNFQSSGAKSKIQFGSGWWFNDQRDGMVEQMKSLANLGVLSYFVGMLTDSRSFLSYPRHEYFRRILCNLIGGWVEAGEYPNDEKMLGEIIQRICYNNAKEYFNI